ncbi:phosphatidylglycerol lysyltransferase domain-containing protein [Angustibacter sp. Root456]|uniref:phosphatidylglycerol lysyltransferase domain-containing protein n=1 Tax=Angustibacter sp. Root456 TaxID=1736539 RepID=UPI0012FCB2AC|nr:phosphatidylglycerol lysyltransferase domain-containing protein [Angustibacter sp. Root456]
MSATTERDGAAPGSSAASRARSLRRRVPRAMAWVVRAVALLSLVSLFSRSGEQPHHRLGDALLDGTTIVVVVALAAVSLVLARALARRKRRAWRVVLGIVAVAAVLYARARAWEAAGLNLAVAALLVWTRGEFRAESEPSSRWLALRAGLLTAVVSLLSGLALTARTAPDADSWVAVRETVRGLFGFVPDLPYRRPAAGDLTSVVLTGLGVATVGVVLLIMLSPRRKPAVLEPDDERRLRDLLARHGCRDSLGYFALRRDKSVVFSPSGKAAVAYRVVGGVTLASGDPLGDPEAWPGAIAAWLDEADRFAWTPGVLGASQDGATAFVRAGLDALEIGDEAVLDLTTFSLEGRERRSVRQAVSRVRRAGYTCEVGRQRDLSADQLAEVAQAADAMRDGDVERGFSMALGRVGDPADGDVVVVRARDADGRLVAVLSLVPWGDDGLSLDLMRRSQDSENGTMEYLVTELAAHARDLGVRRMSLNFAVFRSALERGGQVGAGPVLRAWRSLLLWASRWWQIESLYRANAKYQPAWVPRMVCFARPADLPHVAVAALQAEAFVVRPSLSRWLRPRR